MKAIIHDDGTVSYEPTRKDAKDDFQVRCQDCFFLVEGDNGEWFCDNMEKEIHEITFDVCDLEEEW